MNAKLGRVAAFPYKCDVGAGPEVEAVFADIGAAIAPATLDVLVNNAGVAAVGSVTKTTEADLDRQ